MKERPHPLHVVIADLVENTLPEDLILLRDEACGGEQRLPLFSDYSKSRATEYCNVDLLALQKGRIKAIFEIEESDIKPTQIFGKFLSSALSKCLMHKEQGEKPVEMDESTSFIQIVDTSKLKMDRTSKTRQWRNIEKSIVELLPLGKSTVKKYRLIPCDVNQLEDETGRRKFMAAIRESLS